MSSQVVSLSIGKKKSVPHIAQPTALWLTFQVLLAQDSIPPYKLGRHWRQNLKIYSVFEWTPYSAVWKSDPHLILFSRKKTFFALAFWIVFYFFILFQFVVFEWNLIWTLRPTFSVSHSFCLKSQFQVFIIIKSHPQV